MKSLVPRTPEQTRPARATPPRGAFTLFELLLVLTILVTLAALSWPRLAGILKRQHVEGTAEQVRQLLDKARIRAVEEGRTIQVRFEPNGRRYVMLPQDPFDPNAVQAGRTSAPGLPNVTKTPPEPFHIHQLADDCRFYIQDGLHQTQRVSVEKLEDAWLGHLDNAYIAKDAVWTPPILYYPDGSATDGIAVVMDRERRSIDLRVRGLTGTVYAAPLAYQPEVGGVASK